ncbi:hypothetical protein HYW83_03105 [Candidatus Peregrinibacteria bacterium]|nr:hypothetical protein [Candidatus Peregrinibacteria bacterium]
MQLLNCFLGNFLCAAHQRLIFLERKDASPAASESLQVDGPPEISQQALGKNVLGAANSGLERLQQIKFKDRFDIVRKLEKKRDELYRIWVERFKRGEFMPETNPSYESIREEELDLAKQFNAELDLNIDFQNLLYCKLKTSSSVKGLFPFGDEPGSLLLHVEYQPSNEKVRKMDITLNPDGTFESHTSLEDFTPPKAMDPWAPSSPEDSTPPKAMDPWAP